MKTIIIGGNFGETPKASGIVNKLGNLIEGAEVLNGGTELPKNLDADLILWMPNVSNEVEKQYPTKKTGSILICSKVMREGYRKIDAISRIFKMHGNAVIMIFKPGDKYVFGLLDALGNLWYSGDNLEGLVDGIKKFVEFTKSAVRVQTKKEDIPGVWGNGNLDSLKGLITANKKLQEYIQTSCGNRFFGNISTRCQKLFPSLRAGRDYMFVSPRNSNKESLEAEDMILYTDSDTYSGNNKPSVDSPAQMRIYKILPNINFMIHGHAIIEGAKTTEEYRLCGDIREVDEVKKIIESKESKKFMINLKNHGFLLGANSLNTLNEIINEIIEKGNVKITNQ